jgi:hypothetical protein
MVVDGSFEDRFGFVCFAFGWRLEIVSEEFEVGKLRK